MKKLFVFWLLFFSTFFAYGQLTDVWDFGATALDNVTYNNKLDAATINSWYSSSIVAGSASTANVFPSAFTFGDLSWTGGTNDRLRTINTAVTRYDNNVASVSTHNGRLYCNAFASVSGNLPTLRYFTLNVLEDDEVKIVARGDTEGLLNFVNAQDPSLQADTFVTTATAGAVTEATFVAKYAGNYKIYDAASKASYFRIYRKHAVYTSVIGNVDVSTASGIPAGYSIVFTNTAGKSWSASVTSSGTYSINLPVGYSYTVSLANASGYIITNGTTTSTSGVATPTYTHNVVISGVALYQVTGSISGLGTAISNLALSFVPPSGSVYLPNPIIDYPNATYSVYLEPNVQYTIAGQGVNDYEILANTLTIPAQNTTSNIAFSSKTKYPVSIVASGLTTAQQGSLQLTFSNINETGYVYSFSDLDNIGLRNGTYKISYSGLDHQPVELALTSNLIINNASATKSLTFVPVTVWSFDDKAISSTTTAYYKGMQLNGQVTTVVSSGHLTAKTGSSLVVPMNPGQKMLVSYYYTANFSIDGGADITTNTNSTSVTEKTEYIYTGASPGFATINVGGASTLTTYITEIKVLPNVAYSPTITVGVGKDYATINSALDAISNMQRPNLERVTVLVDSGNYEEMLVVNQPNVTLKNASDSPNTKITDAGVNIASGAVRVTSYYGHGYNYYSMSNQKWNQNVLAVNQQNAGYSYTNTGAGTTNGSYWNATVVVNANGFTAEGIIFENSFNQYISLKESQDTVVPWSSGSPGARPTDFGNTAVQSKSLVERAAAIAIANNVDKVILNQCRVIGRQDTFYGGTGARVVVYKGDVMGAVDFIFGGMDAVFYKTNLVMNTSDQSSDLSYITAPQQSSGRGFLMYQCNITTANPLVETASTYRSKPGYFGRPWQATTSEAVFYNTTIETSNFPGFVGNSLIMPLGWMNTLGGTSSGMYEYGTTELSNVNNASGRATWATYLSSPTLNDGTEISTFNFTKGNDGWDPIPLLDSNNSLGTTPLISKSNIQIYGIQNEIFIKNIGKTALVKVFSMSGNLLSSFKINQDTHFRMPSGVYIVNVESDLGIKSTKVLLN